MVRPIPYFTKRLNDLLSSIYRFPLSIIEAPMGFGKTTAMKLFLSPEDVDSIWVVCETGQDTVNYFWDMLSSGVGQCSAKSGTMLKRMGFPENESQIEKSICILRQAEFKKHIIFLMDNYEAAKSELLNHFIVQIARSEMANFHFVLLSRDATAAQLQPMLSDKQCNVITREQIKFTEDEVFAYCKLLDRRVSTAEIDSIVQYTNGWVSMVYIMMAGRKNHIPMGANDTVDEWIDKALFRTYDEATERFLLQLSYMGSFTAKQAAFVTQNKNAAVILHKLQKTNAFITCEDDRYQIHGILLDFLKKRRQFSKKESRLLHKRLGQWLIRQHQYLAAYANLARAGETEMLLAHLNDSANNQNDYTNFEGADAFFESVPQKLLFQYPIAYLKYIFFSILMQKKSAGQSWLEQINELRQFVMQAETLDKPVRSKLIGDLLVVQKFTKFNDWNAMSLSHSQIVGYLNGDSSSILMQENEYTFGLPHLLYLYYRDAGSFKKLVDSIVENANNNPSYAEGCGAGADELALAEYACETCDHPTAELHAHKAIEIARAYNQTSIITCAQFTLIRIYTYKGYFNEALKVLTQMQSLEKKAIGRPVLHTCIDLCKGYIYATQMQPDKIPLWLQIGDMSAASLLFSGLSFHYLVYGKALLAQGYYEKLESLNGKFEDRFSTYHNQLGRLHNQIFLAAALYARGKLPAGMTALRKALHMAEADGIVMPFAENAVHLSGLLKKLVKAGPKSDFEDRVLTLCNQMKGTMDRARLQHPSLSKRELEVLRLLAEGLTRNEIADRLYISPGTVKSHVQSIYQKLEVSGRIAAIKAALAFGYL